LILLSYLSLIVFRTYSTVIPTCKNSFPRGIFR